MSDTLPLDLNSNPPGIERRVSGIADPFSGHIDEFRPPHIQRSDGWLETNWNNMSDPRAFAVAGAEEQEGGEPLPLAGVGVVVCLMRGERTTAGGWTIQAIDQAYVPFRVFAAWDDVMVARRSANPLAMLWPEMDAQLVAHQLRRRRPVVIVAGS